MTPNANAPKEGKVITINSKSFPKFSFLIGWNNFFFSIKKFFFSPVKRKTNSFFSILLIRIYIWYRHSHSQWVWPGQREPKTPFKFKATATETESAEAALLLWSSRASTRILSIPNRNRSSESTMATNSNFLFLLVLLFNFHLRLSFSDGQFSPLFFFYITSMLLKWPILIVFEFWGASGDSNSMESVPDLQKSMYKVIDGYPCVRLLNLSGPIGCSSKFYLNFLT